MRGLSYHRSVSLLHWLTVVLLAWLIWGGRALSTLIDRGFDFDFIIRAYAQHKAVGVAVFFLALLRLLLRWWTTAPPHEPGWRGVLAKWVQRALYATILIYPITGFAFHSASTGFKTPVSWGQLTFPDWSIGGETFWHMAHQACLYLLGLLLLIHIAGAMFHLVVRRDGVFRRILPF